MEPAKRPVLRVLSEREDDPDRDDLPEDADPDATYGTVVRWTYDPAKRSFQKSSKPRLQKIEPELRCEPVRE